MTYAKTVLAGWLLATGCSESATALLLEVTDAAACAEIDHVVFTVTGPGIKPGGRTANVRLSETRFPLTLTLVHRGAAMGPLEARVEGRLASEGAARCEAAVADLYFERGQVVRRRLILQPRGGGSGDGGVGTGSDASGGGLDTGSGGVDATAGDRDAAIGGADTGPGGADGGSGGPDVGAVVDGVDPRDVPSDRSVPPVDALVTDLPLERLPDAAIDLAGIDVPLPRDVGVFETGEGTPADAAPDTQRPPATDAAPVGCGTGCACQQTCSEGADCRCAGGCACTLACQKNKDCATTCAGANTVCSVDSADVSNGRSTCAEGATCLINGSGKTSNLDVACQGASSCDVDCTGQVSNCRVACTGGSRCLVHCAGASNCGFESCSGGSGSTIGMRACPGSIQVCNRACP